MSRNDKLNLKSRDAYESSTAIQRSLYLTSQPRDLGDCCPPAHLPQNFRSHYSEKKPNASGLIPFFQHIEIGMSNSGPMKRQGELKRCRWNSHVIRIERAFSLSPETSILIVFYNANLVHHWCTLRQQQSPNYLLTSRKWLSLRTTPTTTRTRRPTRTVSRSQRLTDTDLWETWTPSSEETTDTLCVVLPRLWPPRERTNKRFSLSI